MDGGARRSRRVDYPKHDRQPAGRGQAPPPRNLPRAQAGVCGDDSEWPPPARPVLPDFGPERVQGRPRSHSPREQRPRRSPVPGQCASSRRGGAGGPALTWLIPRPRGASPRLGPEPGQAAAESRLRSHSGSQSRRRFTALTVSAPPPWNSDQARRGGWGRELLKGPLSSPGRPGGLGEELESPDWGTGPEPGL